MRLILFTVALFGFVVLGCTGKPLPDNALPDKVAGNASAKAPTVPTNAPTASKSDLSVPRLEPKPVIWLEDWNEEEQPATREKAQRLMSLADRLKAAEKFEEAEKYYQQAMEADPTWAFPAYQLACNYELSNQHDKAAAQFKKALELGFDDFPTALADDELGQIRDSADFKATLLKIRERYVASSKSRVGQPIAVRPTGSKPADGWPVILFLHGYGDSNVSYNDIAEQWAGLGFVAVTVPGSIPASSGSYQWSMDSTDPTDQDLQVILKSPLLAGMLDPKKVFLFGFSQGALHAMLLAAEKPDLYAGVVSLSPGGSLSKQLVPPPLNRGQRPGRVVFIHGLLEPHARIVRIWSDACKTAGWKFYTRTHPGAHHMPANWDEIQPEVVKFLMK